MTVYRTYLILNARVENADGSSSQALDVKGLQVTFDSTWAPYCQAQLTCAQPAAAVMSAIEPRSDAVQRVRFTLRQLNGITTAADVAFDLCLRSRSVAYVAREMTLSATSDEALLMDYADATAKTYASDSIFSASNLAAQAVPPSVSLFTREAGYPDANVNGADAAIDAGTSRWDYAQTMAEAAGARLYCDERRGFHWATPTWTPDTAARTITDAVADGTVLDVVDVVSRDDPTWGNYAAVGYQGNTPELWVGDGSGATNRKAIVVERRGRKPAGNAAARIRARADARGRNLTVRAVAEIVARPLTRWRTSYVDQSWTGLAQSVSFEFPQGTMSLLINIDGT